MAAASLSFNIFSAPPAIPATPAPNSNTSFKIELPPSRPLHLRKQNQSKNSSDNADSSSSKKKGRGKQAYKRKGHSTGKLVEEQGIVLSEDCVSYLVKGAPFEFRFSYTEVPKEKPLAVRDPPLNPFAPPPIPRPWWGRGSLKKIDKIVPMLESTKNSILPHSFGPFLRSNGKEAVQWNPQQVLGEPLSDSEVNTLLKRYGTGNRQVNIGRDGLTHNMLELIHGYWKRRPICKIRCKGVPTIDIENICQQLEERTGGKILRRRGGVVYMFRGRNYRSKNRPRFPLMLWKPVVPVYPNLIERAPPGLTVEEADALRRKARYIPELCKLAKNGVYLNLVRDVREAFKTSEVVKINCHGMKPSDYKRIGVKLKELVPCILLSFVKQRILLWRGKYNTYHNSEGIS